MNPVVPWAVAGTAAFTVFGAWVIVLAWRRIRSGPASRRNPRGSYSGEVRRIVRYSAAELADLTRGDIDPGWEHTRRAVAELDDDLGPDGGAAA